MKKPSAIFETPEASGFNRVGNQRAEDLKEIKLIEWRDSSMQITQEPQDSKWEVQCLASVGFVLVEDNDKIVLAGDLLEGDCRRVIVIPKENITRNKTLFL